MNRTLKIGLLLIAIICSIYLYQYIQKPSVLGISYGHDYKSKPIYIVVEMDEKLVFQDSVYPTYIIPELIELNLSTGWHEVSAYSSDLNLKLKESFFTLFRNHLDVVIYDQYGEKGIYLLNTWKTKYYH